jgi:hypothetical protein
MCKCLCARPFSLSLSRFVGRLVVLVSRKQAACGEGAEGFLGATLKLSHCLLAVRYGIHLSFKKIHFKQHLFPKELKSMVR